MLNRLVAILLAAIPALVLVVDRGGSIPLSLLALIGLVVAFRHRTWTRLARGERVLFAVVGAYVAVSVLSVLVSGVTDAGLSKLETHARLLTIIPIYLLVRQLRPAASVVWLGIVIGALGAGLVALYQVAVLDLPRAIGANNAIHFGNLSLLLGFMSVLALSRLPTTWPAVPARALRALAIVAAPLGILASVLSGTRGAWLALPVLLFIVVAHYWRDAGWRPTAVSGAVLLLMSVTAYYIPHTGVQARIHAAEQELLDYYEADQGGTSLGLRLDMWKAAVQVVQARPLVGAGLGHYEQAVGPLVDAGTVHPAILQFQDAHSEYLSTLMSRGLLGLAALLALLLYPLALLRRGGEDMLREPLAAAVLVAGAGYLVHAVHNNVFERGLSVSFFVFALGGLAALFYAEKEA